MLDAAVIVAGGGAKRLGGIDKALLTFDGRSLLDGVLSAVGDVVTVVVGPRRSTPRPVLHVTENPPGSGPAAGIAAGIRALVSEAPAARVVAVLAADLPGISVDSINRLCAELDESGAPGAIFTDLAGHEQWLTAVWQLQALTSVLETRPSWVGASVRSLLAMPGIRLVTGSAVETADIDTPSDIESWPGLRTDSQMQNGESGPAVGG